KAGKALKLAENPEIFLSTVQLGITLIAILTGLYSGDKFGRILVPAFEKIPFLSNHAVTISTTLVVIIVTFVSIILGELIPKRIALSRAEHISRLVAGPMVLLAKITYPFVWLLSF